MKLSKSAVVIGASLSGLLTALALAKVGVPVTVLERSKPIQRRGATLSVGNGMRDTDPIANYLRAVAAGSEGGVESWHAIYRRLQKEADQQRLIDIYYETEVVSVSQDDGAVYAQTASGIEFQGDLLVGADGGRSVVRTLVNPAHPSAEFAGYLLWVALVEEAELPQGVQLAQNVSGFNMFDGVGEDFLFGMVTASLDGSRRPGDRLLGLAWYDNSFNSFLYASGAVKDGVVQRTLNGSSISSSVYETLLKRSSTFPQPWASAVEIAIKQHYLVATPIAEYVPTQLVQGRMGLVGDAAHLMTPMTAEGFNSSLDDATILARQLAEKSSVPAALLDYQSQRLSEVRRIVQSGQSFSRSFGKKE
ncbi:FAD-dependent monooxygenase [Fundicoccus culcitae]|uniref:FAD-dependent monooxygenase n=1 Tax=Fundicoccus culcitae TaxID=2969821 RepID=A0ABY5P2R2_9LACT|nr:FAD-dependent monooxygenase [Fundicoccus culcitae]UUX32765.1 FAD-dependent monooxygenase [Fundicoccus culcitae]